MGIEGILATGVDGRSSASTLYTWLIFGIHNGTKILATLAGLLLPNKVLKPKIIVRPMYEQFKFKKNTYSQLPPEKDFFKSYDGFYKFLINDKINYKEKIKFINYINSFLINKKDSKIIENNASYKGMILNIIKASYNALDIIESKDYVMALEEVVNKFPYEYKSPLSQMKDISISNKTISNKKYLSKFRNILKKLTRGMCY